MKIDSKLSLLSVLFLLLSPTVGLANDEIDLEQKLENTNLECTVQKRLGSRLSMIRVNVVAGTSTFFLSRPVSFKTQYIEEVETESIIDGISCDHGKVIKYTDESENRIYLCEASKYYRPVAYYFSGLNGHYSSGSFDIKDCRKL